MSNFLLITAPADEERTLGRGDVDRILVPTSFGLRDFLYGSFGNGFLGVGTSQQSLYRVEGVQRGKVRGLRSLDALDNDV